MNRRSRSRSRRGMTLIEVMVVVGILLALMSVLFVGVVGIFSDSQVDTALLREARDAELREIAELRSENTRSDPPAPAVSGPVAPELLSARVEVQLGADPVAEWPWVHTLVDVNFVGQFVLTNPDPTATRVRLWFPVPAGARGVRLEAVGEPGLPSDAVYARDGVAWTLPLAPGATLAVSLAYEAPAVDRFVWSVADAGPRPIDLDVTVRLPPDQPSALGTGSLVPTSREPGVLRWQQENLVAPAPIRIELPAGPTPLGRIALVCWLAAGGLFLFCAGFWYLAEGEQPGHLDDFRLGGLLLLALNYTSFYAIFAVLGMRLGWGALPVALLASLPLLTVHVARLTTRRFALTRVMPLAAVTIGLVLAFVYVEPGRPLVVLGAGVAAIAGVTLTWRSWSDGRRSWVAVTEGQRVRTARLAELERAIDGLRTTVELRASQGTAARRVLADLPPGLDAERAAASRTLVRLERGLARTRPLMEIPHDELLGERAHHESCVGRRAEIARADLTLGRLGTALTAAVDALEQAATRAVDDLSGALGEMERALDTMVLVEVELRALAVAAPARLRREVDPALERADGVRAAAAALAERVGRPDGEGLRTLAVTARELGREADGISERLRAAAGPIGEALRRVDAPADPEEARIHCPTCGGAHTAGSRYCSGCGAMRPAELACGACGRVSRLPRHLLRDDWARATVHCGGCGVETAASPSP